MEFFPNPKTFLQIGPFSVQWYAVCILTGAFTAYFLIRRNFRENGWDDDDLDSLFSGCLVFGIIGARIWYVLFSDLSYYLADPIRIVKIWNGGLAIQGGLFGGMLFAYWYLKKHRLSVLRFMDMIFPYVLIAQAFGRWGNFINKEAFGQVVGEEYFAHWPSFLNFIKDNMFIDGAYREPMFFYESIACLVGLGLILLYKHTSKPKRGDLGFAYFLWYGAVRFWIESRRSDSLMFMGLKMAQIVSLAFIVFALVGMSGIFLKKEKEAKPVLLFDLDGTLLNTEPIIHASFLHTFAKFRPDYTLSEQELMDFMGPTLEESFGKYLPSEQVADAIEYYRVFNTEHHGEYVKPFDGVTECITKWKEEGYVVAIVSSKYTDTVQLGLQVCGMTDMFDLVLGRDKYEKSKPDKCGLIEACKILGVSQDQAIYFGDATSDVKAGKNAGMYTVAFVPNTKREAQLRASCPNEVVLNFRDIDEIIHRNIIFSHDER